LIPAQTKAQMITSAQKIKPQPIFVSKVELGKPEEAETVLKELRTLGGKIKSEYE
jgi:hypothetical protein